MKPELYLAFSAVEDEHWWFKARRKYINRLIEKFIKPGPADFFCEVGCGTGGNLCMLASHAPVDAVEMGSSARAAAEARKVARVMSVQPGSLPNCLPVQGPYKGVFSLDVIEHVKDDLAAMKALRSILAADGFMVLTVPAYQWMWSYHDEANHHFRRYIRHEFVQLVEQAGLEVVYSSYFNTILSPLAMLARLADNILGKVTERKKVIGLALPPAGINRILEAVFSLERHLAGVVPIPFGLSIVIVAKQGVTLVQGSSD